MVYQNIQGAKRLYYMVSIHAQNKLSNINKSDIVDVIKWLQSNDINFTFGSMEKHGLYSQLHFHGVVVVKLGFRWKAYTSYGEDLKFHMHWSKVYDIHKARDYCYKHNIRDQFSRNLITRAAQTTPTPKERIKT